MDLHKKFWDSKYLNGEEYEKIDKVSDFVLFSADYFKDKGKVLELGAGTGEDAKFLADKNFRVNASDFSQQAVNKLKKFSNNKFEVSALDIKKHFPFKDSSFDGVLANLVIHYFDDQTTQRIYDEIYRVLKSGGIVAVLLNSKKDPDYGVGKKIGEDFYEPLPGRPKRFFTKETLVPFISKFQILLLDEKGIDNRRVYKTDLIRFIGKK